MNIRDLYIDPIEADAPAQRYRHGMRVHPIATEDVHVECEVGGRKVSAIVTIDENNGAWVSATLDGERVELTDDESEAVVMAAMRYR